MFTVEQQIDWEWRLRIASYSRTRRRVFKRLGPREWAVGSVYSIADIHLFRLYWRFVNTLHPPPATYPNLTAHYERMMGRPAVKRTLEAESAIGYNLPR